jgi:hypothetical protein
VRLDISHALMDLSSLLLIIRSCPCNREVQQQPVSVLVFW